VDDNIHKERWNCWVEFLNPTYDFCIARMKPLGGLKLFNNSFLGFNPLRVRNPRGVSLPSMLSFIHLILHNLQMLNHEKRG
jgi:hypothetical protein